MNACSTADGHVQRVPHDPTLTSAPDRAPAATDDGAGAEWPELQVDSATAAARGGTTDEDTDGPDRGAAAWLPDLTTEDRELVAKYMRRANYPQAAVESVDQWPGAELRHLVATARTWKAQEALRAAERAEAERQPRDGHVPSGQGRVVLEQLCHDHATALFARDRDQSVLVLTAREARRSTTGNHLQGDPGLELERQLTQVAHDRGFATGPPRWDRASKRLLIDLYHRAAEAWWDRGQAAGRVPVPPRGDALDSTRTYRALYPFQRAAINAAYARLRAELPPPDPSAPSSRAPGSGWPTTSTVPEPLPGAPLVTAPPMKETVPMLEPAAPADAAPPPSSPNDTAGPVRARVDAAAPTPARPAPVPNARKGFKLTLWVTATSEAGLADAHGLLQLDGADPVPFCRLKNVSNPLARALQEAYVALERARAKPPRMSVPAGGPPAPSPGSGSQSTDRPHGASTRPSSPATPAGASSIAPKAAATRAQPSLF